MSQDLTIHSSGNALVAWDADQVQLIKTQLCPDLTDGELALYGQICQRAGLDPFAKQIYAIKRGGKMTIQTSIDGFRLVAQRSGRYDGQTPPAWCGDDGAWLEYWAANTPPVAAKIGVYIKGAEHPTWAVATWNEYAQTYQGKPSGLWAKMPATMLAKCAESLALRKGFPNELSGLHTQEEMAQAEPIAVISSEQVDALVAASVAAGIPEAAARKRASGVTADRFDEALARVHQLATERSEKSLADTFDAVEVDGAA